MIMRSSSAGHQSTHQSDLVCIHGHTYPRSQTAHVLTLDIIQKRSSVVCTRAKMCAAAQRAHSSVTAREKELFSTQVHPSARNVGRACVYAYRMRGSLSLDPQEVPATKKSG